MTQRRSPWRDLTLVPGIALISAARILYYLETTLVNLADALEHTPQAPLRDVQVLPARELQTLLLDFNATATDYPETLTVPGAVLAACQHPQ